MSTIPLSSEFTIPLRWRTDRHSPVRWISSHLVRHWPLIIILLIGAVTNAALAAVVPVQIGQAFNAVTATPPLTQNLLRIALIIAFTQIGRGLLQLARNFSAEMISQRMERDIREELYISLLGKSMTFHSLQPIGDTMARATNDVREVNFLFNPGINLVLGSFMFLIIPLIAAPRYHPSLILVPALYMIGYVLALWQYLKELRPVTNEVRSSFGFLNARLAEALDGIETLKGMSQEEAEITLFKNNATTYRNATVRQGDIEARFIPLLLLALAEASAFLHASLLYQQGLLDIGEVVGYFSLIQLLGFPTFTSLFSYSQVSSGLAGARRILELINRETDLDQNVKGFPGPNRGEVVFQDVSFKYGADETMLENLNFHILPGQTVAIVGQTGSGKTSLIKLLNRTYDVSQGKILVDGVDVREWNLEALRRSVSIIEQDLFLFSRSIAENIAFGRQDASQEEIEAAARQAQAHEFILEFKDGYNTIVGERGVTLSGGQRQRIALARAFLTDPPILVLDDSTSSIDSDTEDKIQRAIYAAARGRTTFIITHRLSQIRWADRIIVLRQGKIAALGSHDELLKTSHAYQRIFTDLK